MSDGFCYHCSCREQLPTSVFGCCIFSSHSRVATLQSFRTSHWSWFFITVISLLANTSSSFRTSPFLLTRPADNDSLRASAVSTSLSHPQSRRHRHRHHQLHQKHNIWSPHHLRLLTPTGTSLPTHRYFRSRGLLCPDRVQPTIF